jgi:hypothetical protein
MIALLFLFIPQQIPWPVTTVRKSDPVKIEKAIALLFCSSMAIVRSLTSLSGVAIIKSELRRKLEVDLE